MRERVINKTVSVDCVVFGFENERLSVLLVERKLGTDDNPVFRDYTLTGNHIYESESLDDAARRILYDLTGMNNVFLEQFHAFGDLNRTSRKNDQLWIDAMGRDPKARVITVGYVALLNARNAVLQWKGRNVGWHVVGAVKNLAFDHMKIMNAALDYIRHKIRFEPAIVFELMPEKFTLMQLKAAYEVIYHQELDKRNFYRKAQSMPYIIPLGEKLIGKGNKISSLFRFDREIYDKLMSDTTITVMF